MKKHERDHHAIPNPSGAPGAAPGFEPSSSIAGSVRKPVSDHEYAAEMRLLQIELVKLQRHVIASRDKVLLVVEDETAVEYWKAYSDARNAMLLRSQSALLPWQIVQADNERLARLNLIRSVLSRFHYEGKHHDTVQPDPDIAFEFTPDCISGERLAL